MKISGIPDYISIRDCAENTFSRLTYPRKHKQINKKFSGNICCGN